MSIDQALLDSVSIGRIPTLRWYGWSAPTLSLGYFQPHLDAAGFDVDVVRRSTGGGAILHQNELTYSLTLPAESEAIGSHQAIYQTVHAAVIDVLATFGIAVLPYRELPQSSVREPDNEPEPFLCFHRRTDEDLILSGYKILGSAQRRARGGLLQHGSLLLSVSRHANELPGIQQLSGHRLDPSELMDLISIRLGEKLGINWQTGKLSDQELQASEQIAAQRFDNRSWTQRR